MASILVLRRRIRAAQNVSKTTRAMQMISASKLKRAQQKTIAIRPYVQKLTALVKNTTTIQHDAPVSPYLMTPPVMNKTLLIALSPDKGLCGGLITNLLRELHTFQKAEKNAVFVVVGKKMESYITQLQNETIASFVFGTSLPTYDMVYPIVTLINNYYLTQKVDSVKILSPHFSSIFTQTPKITELLPLEISPSDTIKET